MPETRLEQLEKRLRELDSEVAAELRDFAVASLNRMAEQAAQTGTVDDQEIEDVIVARMFEGLQGVITIMIADATAAVGYAAGTVLIRSVVEDALREAAKDLVPSARLAIAETVATAFRRNWSVDRTARQIRKFITLSPSQVKRMETLAADLKADPAGVAKKLEISLPDNPTQGDLNRVVERFRVKLERERSLAIARQEIWRIGQVSEHQAWEEAVENGVFARGAVTKHWQDQGDSHVRSSHRTIADRYPLGIGLEEGFVTSRGVLRYPLDPRGSADNVIGCRCWLIYKVGGKVR